jgi:hypothetical protein
MIEKGTNFNKESTKPGLDWNKKLKQVNFLDRRVYQRDEDIFYPSVTTILQYMPKNRFFESWLKDVGHNSDIIMRKAGREGTQVHEAAEALLKGEEVNWIDDFGNAKYSQLVWQMIMRFHEFWTTHKPELISTEEFVWSDEHKYAGTADLVVKMDGEIWLLDIKTSNHLHKTYDLQLAAYAKAIEEKTGLKIQRTGILWLKALTRGESKKKDTYQGKGWQIKVVDEIDKNHELFMLIYTLFLLDNPDVKPAYKSFPTALKLE